MVPPTGPESSVCSERSRADWAVTMPPEDCITCSGTDSPLARQLALESRQVAAHDRRRVGVDDRGGRPLVLAPLSGDPVRERDRDVVELLEQDLLGAKLVGRVQVGEQEADGDGAESLLPHAPRGRADGVLVERLQLLAGGVQPAGDLDDVAARHERRRLAVVDVVQARAVAAGDVVDVARALRRQQQDASRRGAGGRRSGPASSREP